MTAAAVGPTRSERTPRNCARSLSNFAGCTEPGSICLGRGAVPRVGPNPSSWSAGEWLLNARGLEDARRLDDARGLEDAQGLKSGSLIDQCV